MFQQRALVYCLLPAHHLYLISEEQRTASARHCKKSMSLRLSCSSSSTTRLLSPVNLCSRLSSNSLLCSFTALQQARFRCSFSH